jgi:hypothetical protein
MWNTESAVIVVVIVMCKCHDFTGDECCFIAIVIITIITIGIIPIDEDNVTIASASIVATITNEHVEQ